MTDKFTKEMGIVELSPDMGALLTLVYHLMKLDTLQM